MTYIEPFRVLNTFFLILFSLDGQPTVGRGV